MPRKVPTTSATLPATKQTVLGKIGNSGPSAGPHLHLGILDRLNPTSARSLPFVLNNYTLVSYVDFDRSTDDNLVINGESKPIEAVSAARQHPNLPLNPHS